MRRLAVTLLAPAIALAFAATAQATIVPQKGMKGIRLSMTTDQVRKVLGKPDAVAFPKSEIQGRYKRYRYGLTTVDLFSGRNGKVFNITTRSPKERTAKGVGVGSTEAEIAAKVPHVRCKVEFGYHHCQIGQSLAGRRVTDFAISRRGRVTHVTIGIVID